MILCLSLISAATCDISGGKLVIKNAANIPVNTELTIIDNAIKQEKETLSNPNYFTGSVTIAAPEDVVNYEPPFIIYLAVKS